MAVDVCSENSSVVITSPRISFSYDLNNQQADPDIEAAQKYIKGSETESDFFFSIISPSKCLHEPCVADEIFSNGKLLPTQIKTRNPDVFAHFSSLVAEPKKIRLKELLESEVEEDEEERKPAEGKSFWKFRRSSSLNFDVCGSGRGKGEMNSIQVMSRRKSTSSVPSQKQSTKQNRQKPSGKSHFQYYNYGASSSATGQKPPLGRTKSYSYQVTFVGGCFSVQI